MTTESSTPPAVRVVAIRTAVRKLMELPLETRAPVMAELQPIVEMLDADVSVSWIPIPFDIVVTDASRAILSPQEFQDFWRDVTLVYLKLPILRSLAEAATRLFGVKAQSILRWAPRAWAAMFRNCGTLTYEPTSTERESRLRLDGFPRQEFASGSFVAALGASFNAAFAVTRTTGTIEILSVNPAAGAADFLARHG